MLKEHKTLQGVVLRHTLTDAVVEQMLKDKDGQAPRYRQFELPIC
jgi:hypothetical protein